MPQSVSSTTSEGNSKDFIVFLTIEGTEYRNIECVISDPFLPIKDLIERIVKKLRLPKTDNGGNLIQYLLGQRLNEDNEPGILEFEDADGREQTLVDYNIQSGDQLVLMRVSIAGGNCIEPDSTIAIFGESYPVEENGRIEDNAVQNFESVDSSRDYSAPYRNTCAPRKMCADSASVEHPAPCAERPMARPNYDEPDLTDTSPDDEEPSYLTTANPKKVSLWKKLFGKRQKSVDVNASAYAPAQIVPYEDFMVRVFVHIPEEIDNINSLIKEIDPTSAKKANKPLDIAVTEGDKITVSLMMPEDITIDRGIQTGTWRGKSLEFDFGCQLEEEYVSSRLCKAIIAVNDVPAGELKFILKVVYETPDMRTTSVDAHKFSKIFISYSHADYELVRGIAEGCRINASDYFFDRHTLKGGDIFKDKILEYINSADLFVLCWSENAASSKWVQMELNHAMERIEKGSQTLSIYPICVPPPSPLPSLISDRYNFINLL